LFSLPVDGLIFAQPLYVPNLQIPGLGTHNVIYVAMQHNSVYAFDADNGATLWSVNVGPFQPKNACTPDTDVGIMGTPVIAPSSNTIYLVARTLRSGNSMYELHALDITTGA
jgi:outer membrane protein assembly factor BamB